MHIARISLIVLFALLAGCGFQLRGSEQVRLDPQLQVLYVHAAAPNSEIARRVTNSLEVSGVTLVDAASAAPFSLHIGQEEERILTATVGGAAQATSRNLMLSVSYTVQDRDGAVVAGPEQLRLERLVQHNVLAVNASEREMEIARQDLRTQLAQLLIRQLQNLRLGTTSEGGEDAS